MSENIDLYIEKLSIVINQKSSPLIAYFKQQRGAGHLYQYRCTSLSGYVRYGPCICTTARHGYWHVLTRNVVKGTIKVKRKKPVYRYLSPVIKG